MFEREEKLYIDPKTKKARWITTKQGLKKDSRTPVYDKLKPQIKAKQKKVAKANRDKWIKRYKKAGKTVNKALDWIEGTPTPKKQKLSTQKPRKKQYIVRNGVAYPIYKPKIHKTNKKKPKKTKDPFDFEIKW